MPYSEDIFYRRYADDHNRYQIPVVLLHGSGGTHLSWPSELRRLENQRVFALDLPGHGRTTSTVCHSIQTMVFILNCFMQNMKIHRVILAGHSLGAVLALHYAAVYPENVKGLFLLSCGAEFSFPNSIYDQLRGLGNIEQVVESFNQLAFDQQFRQESRREVLAPMLALRRSILLADLAICANFSPKTSFHRITCPVKLVAGENDLITEPVSVRELTHSLPMAKYMIIPQCGHLLLYEKTALILGIISSYLQDIADG